MAETRIPPAIYFAASLNGNGLGDASGGFSLEENYSRPSGVETVIGWILSSKELSAQVD